MNAITYRAKRRETSRALKAAAFLRDNCGAVLLIVGVVVLTSAGVWGVGR